MGISPTQLLIILVIVALIFGTKKLRGFGGDLGGAVKGFKKAMSDEEKTSSNSVASLTETVSETAVETKAKDTTV